MFLKETCVIKIVSGWKDMQTNHLLKKGLAVGIIFLFIGVAAAPSINSTVVKASDDNDLMEVTSQACGVQGFGNTSVKLTTQQYNDLEQYLVDFRARLNQTTTREEAVPIFKDAVLELNKYGLLPKGMSVAQAQRLVTIGYRIQRVPTIMKKLDQSLINYDCLFTAKLLQCNEYNIWTRIAVWLWGLCGILLPAIIFEIIGWVKPLRFNNEIEVFSKKEAQLFFSIGLGGIKYGPYNISKVYGFTGLVILLNYSDITGYKFFLGSALEIWV